MLGEILKESLKPFPYRPLRPTMAAILALLLLLVSMAAAQSASVSFVDPAIRIQEGGASIVRVQKSGNSVTAVTVRVRVSLLQNTVKAMIIYKLND